MKIFIWIIALPALVGALFFHAGPGTVWQTFTGPADMGAMTLENLERTGKPNDALIGLSDTLPIMPDAEPPIYALPAQELFAQIITRIDATQTVTWAEQDNAALYARAVAVSPLLRFPDTNHIWVLPVDETHSTLALYAASKLGHSDLGKNRERMDSWLALLGDIAR